MRHPNRKLLFNIFITIVVLNMAACQNEEKVPLDEIPLETSIERFDRAFFEADTNRLEAEIARLEQEYPPFFSAETELIFWRNQRRDPLQNELYELSEEVFGEMLPYQKALDHIIKRYYYYFGVKDTLAAYAYISRLDFNFPTIFAPPYLFMASDLYLGKAGEKYYQALPQYLQYERQPQFLLRDVAYALAQYQVPPVQDPASFLENMIYHGKILWLAKSLYPQLDEATLLKYPPKKLKFAEAHEKEMWVYFIENELLFKSDQNVERRFLEVAPFSKFRTKIDQETPGRIGRWFGYKIFSAYAQEAKDQDMLQLLQERDARKVLKLSGYKP